MQKQFPWIVRSPVPSRQPRGRLVLTIGETTVVRSSRATQPPGVAYTSTFVRFRPSWRLLQFISSSPFLLAQTLSPRKRRLRAEVVRQEFRQALTFPKLLNILSLRDPGRLPSRVTRCLAEVTLTCRLTSRRLGVGNFWLLSLVMVWVIKAIVKVRQDRWCETKLIRVLVVQTNRC